MTRSGLKVHMTRTPRKMVRIKPPKGKTLRQVREKGQQR